MFCCLFYFVNIAKRLLYYSLRYGRQHAFLPRMLCALMTRTNSIAN